MAILSGQAEFNGNAWIRGTLKGATGEFSGTLSAEAANFADTVNIRDGTVSYYLIVTWPDSLGNAYYADITIPPQPGKYDLTIKVPLGVIAYENRSGTDAHAIIQFGRWNPARDALEAAFTVNPAWSIIGNASPQYAQPLFSECTDWTGPPYLDTTLENVYRWYQNWTDLGFTGSFKKLIFELRKR